MTRYSFRIRRQAFLRLLARKNLSQNALARRCGLSSGFLSQLLSADRLAGPKTRQKIMAVFPSTDFERLFDECEVGPAKKRKADPEPKPR